MSFHSSREFHICFYAADQIEEESKGRELETVL